MNERLDLVMYYNQCSREQAQELLDEFYDECNTLGPYATWDDTASIVDSILNLPTDLTALFYY